MAAAGALQKTPIQPLITIRGRDRSVVGWKYVVVEAHLDNHLVKTSWCNCGCMATTCFGRDTEANRARVRQRLRHVQTQMIKAKRFLVIQYADKANGRHGEALKFKIFTAHDEDEKQVAVEQLEGMRRRKQISEARYLEARVILHAE